jgi:hypothetical protein
MTKPMSGRLANDRLSIVANLKQHIALGRDR